MKCFKSSLNGRYVIEAVIDGKKIIFNQKFGESLSQFLISVAGLTADLDD